MPARKLQTVVMSLDGNEHDLQVGYIAATPVWRPSYRLVIDEEGASLQTWGIVQNLSGEDWTNVSLSLIAEAPLAFDAVAGARGGAAAAAGHRRRRRHGRGAAQRDLAGAGAAAAAATRGRPAAPASLPSPTMEADMAGGGAAESGRMKKAMRRRRAGMAQCACSRCPRRGGGFSGRARNLAALATIAVQAGATRYDLGGTVTIPDGSATMVMLLDQHVPGEAISLFAPDGGVPDSSSHPFRVARFTNKTGGLLERGPLAIFAGRRVPGPGHDRSAARRRDRDRARSRSSARWRSSRAARRARRARASTTIEAGVLTIARDAGDC